MSVNNYTTVLWPNRRGVVLTGGQLSVDQVNGSDSSGQRGNLGKPFATLTAAKNAALSGDVITVGPGTYVEHDLLKNGVNWYFEEGAVVSWNEAGTGAGYGIFDDRSSGACTCMIGGYGKFVTTTTTKAGQVGNPNYNGLLVVTNVLSAITLRGKRMDASSYNFDNPTTGSAAVYVSNCALVTVELQEGIIGSNVGITSLDPADGVTVIREVTTGIYWELGECHVRCGRIYTDASYCLWGHEPAGAHTTNLWINVDYAESLNAPCLYMAGNSPNYRVWVMAKEALGQNGVNVIDSGAGGTAKFYVIAEKIGGTGGAALGSLNCQSWITTQKLAGAGAGVGFMVIQGGTHFISVQQYEDPGGTMTTGISITGGTGYIMGGLMKVLNGKGIGHGGGTLEVSGLKVDTTNTNSVNNIPASVTAAGLILRNCVLLAPALADSVKGDAARTITNYGSVANKAKNANITVNVQALLVDANVV